MLLLVNPEPLCRVQCNSFEGHEGLSLTAVGARRGLAPTLPVVGSLLGEEDVGMIGIHISPRICPRMGRQCSWSLCRGRARWSGQ